MRVKNPFRAAFNLLVRKAPVEAQLVVIRRCNLSCGYCSEYDAHSPEVTSAPSVKLASTRLHRLRVVNIALLGGEPLLHPDRPSCVRHAARQRRCRSPRTGSCSPQD